MSKQEDDVIARQLVETDLRRNLAALAEMRSKGLPVGVACLDGKDDPAVLLFDDGDRVFMHMTIGFRGQLNKRKAREAAELFGKAVTRYPKAFFYINILGYDDDPRELWEFPDVTRYIRWWARFSGMDSVERAAALIGPDGLAFLCGCGVFGEEVKAVALRNFKPTVSS